MAESQEEPETHWQAQDYRWDPHALKAERKSPGPTEKQAEGKSSLLVLYCLYLISVSAR